METGKPDIQLEESSPFWLRFCLMAAACFALVWEITARFTQADAPSRGDHATLLFILFICGWIILEALFKCNVRWTIQSNEIRIGKNWIYSREQVELVKSGDITKIKIATQSDEGNDRFYNRLWLASGQDIESPPVDDAQRARELQAKIASRLNAPHELVTPPK